jgi:hypothetical protein
MKIALHVHTNLSDAAFFPEEAVQIYADLGFGGLAITDHEFLLRDNYPALIHTLDRCGMILLAGVEIDYQPWNYHHLLRIQGETQTLHVLAHPASYYLEIPEVVRRLHSEPFPVDAIEISHRGFYTPLYDTPDIPAAKVASDDAHEPGDCGRAWIEMDPLKSADHIIRAVKAGDFQARFFRNPMLVR